MIKSFEKYDSFDQLISTIDKNKCDKSTIDGSSEHWAGSKSLDHTFEIIKNGYELDTIAAELEGIASNEGTGIAPYFDVSGSEVEIGRFLTGEPECMMDFEMTDNTKYVHLIVSNAESSGIKTQQFINRSIAICSLIDHLENNNYRVKVSLVFGNIDFGGKDIGHITLVQIKEYDNILPLSSIAGMLHPSTFRRAIFAYWESKKGWAKPTGHGHSASRQEIASALKRLNMTTDLFLFLPSISEKAGGHETKELKETFKDIESARRYADWIVKNVDILQE